jgi:hypothetical protein
VPRYSHRCKITANIPFPKTARLWLAWFSAVSITSTGGEGSPHEGQEEFRRRCTLIASPQFLIAVRAGLLVPFVCSETNELGEELVGSYRYQVHLHHELKFHDYERSCQAMMLIKG